MRYDQIPSQPHLAGVGFRHTISRRAFIGRTSALALGAVAAPGFVGADRAAANPNSHRHDDAERSPGTGLAEPIPYGNDFLGNGQIFHVEAPPFPGFGEDPSTVYNFSGISAIGLIDGKVVRKNRLTAEEVTLPFTASDMRFMQGRFDGRDGRVHHATFGFV